MNVREKRLWTSEGMEDTQRTQPAESTKQSSYWLTETKVTRTGPIRVFNSFVYMLWV